MSGHPDIDNEINETTLRLQSAEADLQRLEAEEAARREEMLQTAQQITHLQQVLYDGTAVP